MQAHPTSMSEIMSGPKRYVIPVFQRYYEWEEERWKTLWKDIVALLDETNIEVPHFIGPMVMIGRTVPYDVPLYLVIDGQQRLMTFFVLLSAIRDYADQLDLSNLADSVDSNSLSYKNKDGEKVSKIIPRLRDQSTLNGIFLEDHTEIDPDSLLVKAYNYFLREIEGIAPIQQSLFDDLSQEDMLNRLHQTILHRLKIVMISLDTHDNPSNIYESLNFKQDLLSDADLVRNYVFMQLTDLSEQETFNSTYWQSFEESFQQYGQDSKKILTDFYHNYLKARSEYVPSNRIYEKFTTYVDKFLKSRNLTQLVNQLKQYGRYYNAIINNCDDPDLEVAFKRYRRLDANSAIPLILHLYRRYLGDGDESKISKSVFLNMLRIIESFILRRIILRGRTRDYGRDFTIARSRAQDLKSLMQYFAEKGWPTDQQIQDAMKEFEFYRRDSKRCNLVLKEIELSYGHKEKLDLDNESIQIEHVMPQNLNLHWRETLGKDADTIHEKYLHTLGNLTLTAYNPDLSDRKYSEKRQIYQDSNFQLNSYFATHEKWAEKDILERTEELTKKFIEIWPRPENIATPIRKKKPSKKSTSTKSSSHQPPLIKED